MAAIPQSAMASAAAAQKAYPDAAAFAAALDSAYPGQRLSGSPALAGNTIGDQWLTWYNANAGKNPGVSLGQWERAFWFQVVAVGGFANALGQAVQGTAQGTAQLAQGTASGIDATAQALAPLTAIGDFFGRLTEGNTWIRIGEGLLGVLLIAVGIAHMTNAVPAATKIAKMVK